MTPAKGKGKSNEPSYTRVLVGSDGSERAGRAVERAADVARSLGASLTVLGVGTGLKLLSMLEEQTEPLRSDGLEVEVRVEPGNPAQVLIEVAERDGYDLLVMGNKGMTGLERLRLGSVPNKVTHHIPCSLLIVRTG